jgi:hypothetical protein
MFFGISEWVAAFPNGAVALKKWHGENREQASQRVF